MCATRYPGIPREEPALALAGELGLDVERGFEGVLDMGYFILNRAAGP